MNRQRFANPAVRRLFLGRLVTNAGDSLYAVAAMWLVYSLSGSTTYTGFAGFLTMGPQDSSSSWGRSSTAYPSAPSSYRRR